MADHHVYSIAHIHNAIYNMERNVAYCVERLLESPSDMYQARWEESLRYWQAALADWQHRADVWHEQNGEKT